MPAVVIVEVVADNGDFGPLVDRPVVSGGRVAVSTGKSPLRKAPPSTIK
jgi:hypothetical protein